MMDDPWTTPGAQQGRGLWCGARFWPHPHPLATHMAWAGKVTLCASVLSSTLSWSVTVAPGGLAQGLDEVRHAMGLERTMPARGPCSGSLTCCCIGGTGPPAPAAPSHGGPGSLG